MQQQANPLTGEVGWVWPLLVGVRASTGRPSSWWLSQVWRLGSAVAPFLIHTHPKVGGGRRDSRGFSAAEAASDPRSQAPEVRDRGRQIPEGAADEQLEAGAMRAGGAYQFERGSPAVVTVPSTLVASVEATVPTRSGLEP